jgi:ribulose 1,5-bisphosphate carboxylase large subunit-like protein
LFIYRKASCDSSNTSLQSALPSVVETCIHLITSPILWSNNTTQQRVNYAENISSYILSLIEQHHILSSSYSNWTLIHILVKGFVTCIAYCDNITISVFKVSLVYIITRY